MRPSITVRRPRFDLSDLPRDWVGGSRWATHFGNAGHVFIPLGEQFFIDAVRAHRDALAGREELRQDVNAFVGQEAVHKRAHEQVWEQLEGWGVPVAAYARVIDAVRGLEAHLPPAFRLSVTAALEHYTAAFGHSFLTEGLHTAVPEEMARLLAWHGLEELEHRAVAYDVLQVVDDGYVLRVAGFAFASGLLVVVPTVGVVLFALADRRPPARPGRDALRLAGMSARLARRMAGHLVGYLAPGFHPGDLSVPSEAERWERELEAPAA